MEIINQLLIIAINKPGILANICGSLTDEKINISGISIVDHVDYAMIRMIVSDSTKAAHLLGEAGLPVMEDKVIKLYLSEEPGSLEKVANVIGEIGENIHYAYATETPDKGKSTLILKTSNDEKCMKELKDRNIF